jgi:hypothetical protein
MNDEEGVTCQMCGAKFDSQQELDDHNQKEHGEEPKQEGE